MCYHEAGAAISEDTAALGPVAEALSPPAVTASGWVLGGRYRVIDRIGAGGMAEVFRAHDELLARDVAVKVFRTQPASPDSASGVERQEIELHALARLNHPNLITLFDASIGGGEGPAYLVMELVNGPSLSARIAEGPLSEPQACEVGIQIADALAYVHAQDMVHRDVKPANILLGTDRTTGERTVRARLSDFGIVRLLGTERLTSVDFTLGTASYLAPEQARGSDVGPVADVYSLGLVLIEALTGVRSFDGPALEAVMARLSRGPEIPPDLPPPWPGLLSAMTDSDPELRPSATQVADALRESRISTSPLPLPVAAGAGAGAVAAAGAALAAPVLLGAANTGAAVALPGAPDADTVGLAVVGAPGALPPDPWAPAQRPPRRRPGWLLAAAAVLAALAIGGVLALRPSSQSTAPPERRPASPSRTIHSASTGTHSSPVATTAASVTSSTAPATTSAPPSSSSAARTSSVPSSSAAPSSRTVPSSSSAPSTSGVPSTTTSTAAATSSAPPNVAADPSPPTTTPVQ